MTMAVLATTVSAQFTPWSTYDYTVSGPEQSFNEAWADAKMPGGWPDTMVAGAPATAEGRSTYVVGSVEVQQVDMVPTFFSGVGATRASGAPFDVGFGNVRQVALVQRNGGTVASGSSANGWQRFFYGSSGLLTQIITRATNARAISVWDAADPLDARIAICGETYDERLPLSQSPSTGWTVATDTSPSGFIAVLNGNGDLLWSYHFFAGNDPDADCAVTDLSIRVDAEGNDVVTYCGIFSHGDPGVGTPLSPVLPFAPSGSCTGGATTQVAGQWDGFVGRLIRPDGAPAPNFPQFQSIVGGPGQDGLFGLAEIDANTFVVVGSTQATAGQGGFPIPSACGIVGPYVLGAALLFDASAVPSGALQLVGGIEIGTVGEGTNTMARDVAVGRGAFADNGDDMIYVVGSTDDAGLPGWFALPSGDTLAGPTDGFIAALRDVSGNPPTSRLERWTCRLQGDELNDGLTGISSWNESPDHITVAGWTEVSDGAGGSQFDMDVATWFFNNAIGPIAPSFTGSPNSTYELLPVRRTQVGQVGGSAEDRPCVMGATNATLVGLPFATFGLGQPTGESGGGVAVGENGRCNVVGRSGSIDYPITTGGRPKDIGTDAVRTEFDMLPAGVGGAVGAGRTDGTGFQAATPIYPPTVGSGFTGGTTPFCALNQFGDRIGDPTPASGLRRMLIDFQGTMAGNSTDAAVIISQPNPVAGSILIGVLEFGFPPALPWTTLTGAEIWLGSGTHSLHPFASAVPRSFRFGLATLPPGGGPVSAQMVCFLSTPVGAGGACSSLNTASAALWFDF
ncbi:MAG: hypothetical protein R3F29_13855 [Planctomycetota bacterium]